MLRRAARAAIRNLRPRRIHAYGLGAAKTGTHSLAAMFASYTAAHEPESNRLLNLLCESGTLGDVPNRSVSYLKWKDRRLRLEFDSSQLNGPVSHLLTELFPDAKFILTVRHPRSWLRSITNDSLRRDPPSQWHRWRDVRFGGASYQPGDEPLKGRGLYPLAGYLRYWTWHNRFVRQSVPQERLLVIHTERLGSSLREIEGFVGIKPGQLQEAHKFATNQDFGVVDELDQDYFDRTVADICGSELEALVQR